MSVKALIVHTGISLMLWLAILSLISLMIRGQEIEDLGLITARRGIVLERPTNRTDFLRFEIEMTVPRGTIQAVTLIRTNDFLDLDDFGSMPEGPVVMAIKTICLDGEESPLALFRVEIRRSRLTKPKARAIGIGLRGKSQSLTNALQEVSAQRMSMTAAAPMPSAGGPPARVMGAAGPVVTPMRGGTNKSYSEHMAEMKAFLERKTKK